MNKIIFLLSLLFVGCDKTQQSKSDYWDNDIQTYSGYVIDKRTGFCLLVSRSSQGYYVYNKIDCTEEVLKLCENCANKIIKKDTVKIH